MKRSSEDHGWRWPDRGLAPLRTRLLAPLLLTAALGCAVAFPWLRPRLRHEVVLTGVFLCPLLPVLWASWRTATREPPLLLDPRPPAPPVDPKAGHLRPRTVLLIGAVAAAVIGALAWLGQR